MSFLPGQNPFGQAQGNSFDASSIYGTAAAPVGNVQGETTITNANPIPGATPGASTLDADLAALGLSQADLRGATDAELRVLAQAITTWRSSRNSTSATSAGAKSKLSSWLDAHPELTGLPPTAAAQAVANASPNAQTKPQGTPRDEPTAAQRNFTPPPPLPPAFAPPGTVPSQFGPNGQPILGPQGGTADPYNVAQTYSQIAGYQQLADQLKAYAAANPGATSMPGQGTNYSLEPQSIANVAQTAQMLTANMATNKVYADASGLPYPGYVPAPLPPVAAPSGVSPGTATTAPGVPDPVAAAAAVAKMQQYVNTYLAIPVAQRTAAQSAALATDQATLTKNISALAAATAAPAPAPAPVTAPAPTTAPTTTSPTNAVVTQPVTTQPVTQPVYTAPTTAPTTTTATASAPTVTQPTVTQPTAAQLAAIPTIQKYISNLSAVTSPTAAQTASLDLYRQRLIAYGG